VYLTIYARPYQPVLASCQSFSIIRIEYDDIVIFVVKNTGFTIIATPRKTLKCSEINTKSEVL
jgi:hypothetical protein